MNYFKFSIPLVFMISIVVEGSAQTSLKYTYDDSGNRTEKALWIGGEKKSEQTTDESSNLKKEDVFKELLVDTKISIFPNPTEGSLQVNFINLPEDLRSTISVFDMSGKAILIKTHLSSTNLVDLTHQPSGSYILIITIGEDSTRWKVMKR